MNLAMTADNEDYSQEEPSRPLQEIYRLYKTLFSPLLHTISPSRCIFLPTCSEYAYTAVARFGVVHGSWLALRRFARCHPWGTGGLDPVPERTAKAGRHPTTFVSCDSGPTQQKDTDHLP